MADNNKTGTSLFGPITDTERMGWQLRAVTDLARILREGRAAGFPAIAWMVTTTGGLSGTVLHRGTVTDRRAAFDTWADHLGLTRWPERTDNDRWRHLHAVGQLPTRTTVGLTTDTPPCDDPDTDHPNVDPTTEEC